MREVGKKGRKRKKKLSEADLNESYFLFALSCLGDSLTAEIPLTGHRVPVIFSDEYPFKERFKGGRVIPDSVLGCPALYEEDKAFADDRGLSYKPVRKRPRVQFVV